MLEVIASSGRSDCQVVADDSQIRVSYFDHMQPAHYSSIIHELRWNIVTNHNDLLVVVQGGDLEFAFYAFYLFSSVF
jgi:hypothetical protein